MSRNNKKQNTVQSGGGFVPASYNSHHKPHAGHMSQPVMGATQNSGHGVHSGVGQYSRNSANYQGRRPQGMSRGKKIGIAILIIAIVAGLATGAFFIIKEMQKRSIDADLHDNVSKEEMKAIDNELTGMTKFDEPFTLLLLGSDARADDPDMGARTDTIVLMRIDPTTNTISMVSIPRDTRITIPGAGTNKFNAAYTYGGPSGTIAAVKQLTGVDIDHYAEVNFESLVGLIDSIGGIDVVVDETIDDIDAGDIVIPAGPQHLDGASALVFSRSRAYADGDFTRVSNQRKVIEAIIHKGLEAPSSQLYGLVKASTSFLTTDTAMNVDFIFSLADQIRHNNDYPVTLYTATIPASTQTIDGVSYVIADQAGVNEMMKVFMACGDVSGTGGVKLTDTATASSSSSAAASSSASSAAGSTAAQ